MTTEFYENAEIFITGGSGVVGKAAIEKLLRSCNVKKIYILLRTKYGEGPENRLRDLKDSMIFNVLKKVKPNELDKLVAIPGDICDEGLGISEANKELLKNVSIFFHSAATTRFNEPFRMAIRMNLKSTLECLKLAQTFQDLRIFIHVSTFFCNPLVKYLENKMYPAVFDWKAALQLLDSKYDGMELELDAFTDKMISGFPNTYIFTKHLAEHLVNDYRDKLPVGIYRPSIVVSALEEPEPGYTDTMVGIMGLILIWGTGLIKTLRCKRNIVLNVTPLDSGTKFLLMFTAKVGRLEREKFKDSAPIGLFSSTGICGYDLEAIGNMLTKCMQQRPYEKSFWIPGLKMTNCAFIFGIYTFFLQLLPAMLIDLFLRIFGQKPFMMKIQRKIYYTMNKLNFFLTQEFMSDRATYIEEFTQIGKGTDFSYEALHNCCDGPTNLKHTTRHIAHGCRKFLLKEEDCTIPRSRKIMKGKIFLYNVIRVLTMLLVIRAIYRRAVRYMYE